MLNPSHTHNGHISAQRLYTQLQCVLQLENRGVAKYILRLINYDFISQHICIRWVNSYSDFFTSTNGVKQGGILSPLFFNVYMDNLSAQLNLQHIGCSTGDVAVNHNIYMLMTLHNFHLLQRACKSCWICVLLTDVGMTSNSTRRNRWLCISTLVNLELLGPW